MIKYILPILFLPLAAFCQCPNSTVTLNTQSDVDNFLVNYPSCTILNTALRIEGSDINDLSPLSNLTELKGGILCLSNPSLTSLTGLHNVERINGAAFLENAIEDFTGLESLEHIAGGFQIELNPQLQNFAGLEQLDSITGQLFIYNNNAIEDITAINDLEYIGGILVITLSPLLSNCSIESLCEYIANPNGAMIFSTNGSGCNSQQEIEDNCISCSDENIWTGPSGAEWNNAAHWSLSEVPTDCHHVIIQNGSHVKIKTGMSAFAYTLTVEENAVFETEPNAILDVVINQ